MFRFQELRGLLRSSSMGKSVLEFYAVNNQLDNRTRGSMLDLIVEVRIHF
jgi:hypothetical protein